MFSTLDPEAATPDPVGESISGAEGSGAVSAGSSCAAAGLESETGEQESDTEDPVPWDDPAPDWKRRRFCGRQGVDPGDDADPSAGEAASVSVLLPPGGHMKYEPP